MIQRCQFCGRPLTDSHSQADGMGPVCARKNGYVNSRNGRVKLWQQDGLYPPVHHFSESSSYIHQKHKGETHANQIS